jgi:Fe-S-cluster-containing dehydrogenase component
MGASLALAEAGACRWEKAEILPFAHRPPERTPGKPQRFATAMDLAGSAIGLLVTCIDGRPIKIEGNPKHPASLGATDALAQAAILELYDPDRSKDIVEQAGVEEIVRTWEEFTEFARSHFGRLRKAGSAGFRVLAEASSSPTLAALRRRLLQEFPQAGWHEYEPVSGAAGPYRPQLALDRAEVIVALDADLFGSHPMAVRYARDFAGRRDAAAAEMSRLYAVESRYSITGAAADHRLPVPSAKIGPLVTLLEQEIAALLENPNESAATKATRRGPIVVDAVAEDIASIYLDQLALALQRELREGKVEPREARAAQLRGLRLLFAMAEDLVAHRGRSVVAAGPSHPAGVQAAVRRINSALANVGETVTYTAAPERPEGIETLAAEMTGGKVGTLLILGGNPAYNAPVDLRFADALNGVATSIHLSLYRDETSRACTWHVPRAHFLESWGDARAYDGTYSVAQPMIAPLCGGRSALELLAVILDDQPEKPEAAIRRTHDTIAGRQNHEQDLAQRWRQTVHDGLLPGSQWKPVAVSEPGQRKPAPDAAGDTGGEGELEIVFCRDAKVYDGRFANNGWLQEWPDPITRLTWGNAALMSPYTAKSLAAVWGRPVEDGTLVKLKYKGRELEIPACVMPGQADGSVAVSLGYGRTAAGHVGGLVEDGVEPVGANAYKLRTSDAMGFGPGLTVEPTGTRYPLASVQDHFAIDAVGKQARGQRIGKLVREATLAQYRKHPDFAQHAVQHPPLKSLWQEHRYEGHQWGMAIDLSKCTGCGACVLACQAENNIPIVGRQRVLQGREMHWMRVDRYFRGDTEDAEDVAIVVQPVACQHCEMAPCEQVCPVGATAHDKQGLNVMVYNRCLGTRYCSNNCPYKVRRFNFFNYHKDLADPANEVVKMVYNPEVTVRSRGVMEKCTYCVQRIRAVTIEAKNSRRRVTDGEIKTACQQVCPTRAIVFGNLADEQSEIARLAARDRSYAILAELNVKPRTRYLARIRNPNPKLAVEDGGHSQTTLLDAGRKAV